MTMEASTSSPATSDDPIIGDNNPAHNNFVTCIYTLRLADSFCTVTVTWAKTVISHTLYVTVEEDPHHYTCKIDLKTWQFWGKKGLKSFRVADARVDVFWDLRSARFTSSPEPASGYYVALVSREELALLLGDQRAEALRRTRARERAPREDACLAHKKEIVFAKKCFCTKTTLGRERKEHSVMIESAIAGPYDPEMWISVDGVESIRVPNLHWRFRGHETIVVDGVLVQILWDVHDWLYSSNHSGVGIFVFRRGGESFWDVTADRPSTAVEFCHFLYAWMVE